MRALHVSTSWLASAARLGLGWSVRPTLGPRPEQRLVLYEFEGCPWCRRVREALGVLDLSAEVRPCPKRGERFRPEAMAISGKAQFPLLLDPNTGDELLESGVIVDHLFRHYGAEPAPAWLSSTLLFSTSSQLSSLMRLGAGTFARPSKRPEQPLELFSFDLSPYSRLARERLCELELPYVLRNVAKGGAAREELRARGGRVMVPWLSDPNTGVEMYESAEIVAYLQETWGA